MRGLALALASFVVLAGALAGCTGGSGTDSLSNNPNNFHYSANWAGKGGSSSFDWPNSMTRATVSWPGNVSGGKATLKIFDGAGTQVYAGELSGETARAMSATTATGTAGTWKVDLSYAGFTGQFLLQLRAA